MSEPLPITSNNKIETKVKASTGAAYIAATVLLYILQGVSSEADAFSSLPDAIEPFIWALVPALTAFVGGYLARHTYRP